MNWIQLTLLQILADSDTNRIYVQSDGGVESETVRLDGSIQIEQRDLKEMVERGLIAVGNAGFLHLLNEGGVVLTGACNRFGKAMNLLERAARRFENEEPDENWHRDLYLLTGEHAVLTDEGWSAGAEKDARKRAGHDILDEVNAPV